MVMSLRSAAGMAAIWLTAVAGVSATAWVAIDRAGRDITDTSVVAIYPGPLATPTLGSEPARTTVKGKTPVAPNPTATSSLTAIPLPSPTSEPITTPTPATPTTPATTTAPPAATPADNTINVTGGLVSVRCTGTAIALRIAQPENDWRVRVDTTRPGQIVVSFQRGEEDSPSTTAVTAVCTDGIPAFSVTNS